MTLNRRQLLGALAAGVAAGAVRCRREPSDASSGSATPGASSIRSANGGVDWQGVRDLFPLAKDWTHLASFLFVSHPKPVAEAIERVRRKIDADPVWIEAAAFSEAEGRPFSAVKRALATYTGGLPEEICLTSNTTGGLAMIYHGLRIRSDQHILTTEHDHYVHHESIRYAAERSGCGVRYVALYEQAARANAAEMVDRIAKAIGPKTRALGVTWVHSSTGVKIPVAGFAEAVARANRGRARADRCLLIVDGVHGFANQDVDAARLGADFFAAGTAGIPNVTLHTPRDPDLSGGISCFEVAGVSAEHVAERLAAKKIRTNSSPYKTSYARVAAGIMNTPEEIDLVLREIRALS